MTPGEALALLDSLNCPPEVKAHCKAVSQEAVRLALKIKETGRADVDVGLVEVGGLLHDLGRCRTHGIEHAVVGAEIAREKGLDERLVRIIERHIGAGISPGEAEELGLPRADYTPQTLEEKIVAHADNLVKGDRVVSIEEQVASMEKRGIKPEIIKKILKLNQEIESLLAE